MPRICSYGSHIYMFVGRIVSLWDLYGSFMCKKSLYGAPVRPEWDKCPDSAHMGPIYTCLLGKELLTFCAQVTNYNSPRRKMIPLYNSQRERTVFVVTANGGIRMKCMGCMFLVV